nr:7666_t:CDS:2 [Entrophospora candida]
MTMTSSWAEVKKCNIGWMASYNNPTPIEFFHLLSPSHKSSAFGKHNVLLNQAIKCYEDPVKQLELEKIKETADKEKGCNNVNEEECEEFADRDKIIIHDILNDILLASQAEKDVLDIYCSKFSHFSVMDLQLNSEFSLFLDQELQERILHEVFDTIDNDYVTDEIHNFLTDFFNADHGKEGWCDAIRSIAIDENYLKMSSNY